MYIKQENIPNYKEKWQNIRRFIKDLVLVRNF